MNAQVPTCPSATPYVVVIIILVILVLLLGIWLIYQMFKPKPKTTCPPERPCPSSSTVPVYLYGFAPGTKPRELSNASGVITVVGNQIKIQPLEKANLKSQEWKLIQEGDKVLLQNDQRYLNSNLNLVSDQAQAVRLSLEGPARNGRIYRLRNGKDYLLTEEDLTIKLTNPGEPIPLNTEWILALGTCQATGGELCRH